MAGLRPVFLVLLASLTCGNAIRIQSDFNWPAWVAMLTKGAKNSSKPKDNKTNAEPSSVTNASIKANSTSDMDDVDFALNGLTNATQTEKPEEPSSKIEKVRTRSGKNSTCILANAETMPSEDLFVELADAIKTASTAFALGCHATGMMYGCDPTATILDKWRGFLIDSFDAGADKHIQQDLYEFLQFVVKLMDRADEMPFDEFWLSLEKQDYRAITRHTLSKMADNCPFLDLGLDWDAIEEMLEVSDHDESGTTSYNEFREFINAVIVLSHIPMAKDCTVDPAEIVKLQSWAGVYHKIGEPWDPYWKFALGPLAR